MKNSGARNRESGEKRRLGSLVAYGAGFAVVLPVALIGWASATADAVRLRVPAIPTAGVGLAAAGMALVLWGMWNLWTYGHGLPMNAFPPPDYVERGVFRLLPHPIYSGFVMACAGVSIAAGSASGLWVVTPLAAMGCAALVLGYERHDLAARFGRSPAAVLPPDGPERPSAEDRLRCYLFVFLPWVVAYEAVIVLGLPADARAPLFRFESRLPVVEWAEAFYFSAYLVTALAPMAAGSRVDLRRLCVRGLWAMAIAFPLYLALPLAAPQRPFEAHSVLGRLLAWERTLDNAAGAFPSFHVIWAVLAAEVYASRWRRAAWAWRGWAALVAASCVATGQHPTADVVGGALTAVLVMRGAAVWEAMRAAAEWVANSWREWRIGPVRVINHGMYAGAGAFVALAIAQTLAGPGKQAAILTGALAAVVGAALWAQYVEGSPQLLRPYGFYGGLLGGTLGALAAPLFGTTPWLVLAGFAVGGPWAQAFGRLRCLVQGCCHGRPSAETVGIRYRHPRSRVCRMTEWRAAPLHPTPLYSILWNGFVALAVTRLWLGQAPLHWIAGVYFLLTGLGRFVEEAWRGEPQTPVLAGLRLYQWAAVASVAAGALMTALGSSGPAPAAEFEWASLAPAAGFGLLVWGAMGVDFPESERRFSRLA